MCYGKAMKEYLITAGLVGGALLVLTLVVLDKYSYEIVENCGRIEYNVALSGLTEEQIVVRNFDEPSDEAVFACFRDHLSACDSASMQLADFDPDAEYSRRSLSIEDNEDSCFIEFTSYYGNKEVPENERIDNNVWGEYADISFCTRLDEGVLGVDQESCTEKERTFIRMVD